MRGCISNNIYLLRVFLCVYVVVVVVVVGVVVY